jgi:transcriptional regulator with XRE-family HTH domain
MQILQERIKQLRIEKKWSQDELAQKIDADARQISRYETGRITPSVETVAKLAIAFEVTSDYLLMENAARKPFRMDDKEFLKHIEIIQEFPESDKICIFQVIDAFKAKNKIKSVAQEFN